MCKKKEVKNAKRAAKVARFQAEAAAWKMCAQWCEIGGELAPLALAALTEGKAAAAESHASYQRREDERRAEETAEHAARMAELLRPHAVAEKAEKAPANGAAYAR